MYIYIHIIVYCFDMQWETYHISMGYHSNHISNSTWWLIPLSKQVIGLNQMMLVN